MYDLLGGKLRDFIPLIGYFYSTVTPAPIDKAL